MYGSPPPKGGVLHQSSFTIVDDTAIVANTELFFDADAEANESSSQCSTPQTTRTESEKEDRLQGAARAEFQMKKRIQEPLQLSPSHKQSKRQSGLWPARQW
jgi:hypothetical protein